MKSKIRILKKISEIDLQPIFLIKCGKQSNFSSKIY